MNFMYLKVFIVSIWLNLVSAEIYYAASFSDDIVSCPNFDNKVFKAEDLKVGMIPGDDDDDDDDGGLGLNGVIDVQQAIEEGNEINIKISKVLEVGKELLYTLLGDICSSLEKVDAPWYPLVQSLNTSKCPIPVKVYPVADMKMSLAFAKDVLSHDFCGAYEVELSIVEGGTELSCHVIGIEISERDTDDD